MTEAVVWLRTNTELNVTVTSNTKPWCKFMLRCAIGAFMKRPLWGEQVEISTSLE